MMTIEKSKQYQEFLASLDICRVVDVPNYSDGQFEELKAIANGETLYFVYRSNEFAKDDFFIAEVKPLLNTLMYYYMDVEDVNSIRSTFQMIEEGVDNMRLLDDDKMLHDIFYQNCYMELSIKQLSMVDDSKIRDRYSAQLISECMRFLDYFFANSFEQTFYECWETFKPNDLTLVECEYLLYCTEYYVSGGGYYYAEGNNLKNIREENCLVPMDLVEYIRQIRD